jgi:hypothetical protein
MACVGKPENRRRSSGYTCNSLQRSSVYLSSKFHFVAGVLGARVLRASPDQIVEKVRAVNQEGRYVKTELHAGKIRFNLNQSITMLNPLKPIGNYMYHLF